MYEPDAQAIRSAPGTMVIGVCTFRRPALAQTLGSLAGQSLLQHTSCQVIVADNDDTPSALPIVEQARQEHALALHYVHAPARNISVARNAMLEKAQSLGAEYLAMIDDDEVADSNWAEELLGKISDTSADAVLGRVISIYRAEAAKWMRDARLHDTSPVMNYHGEIHTGYTGNAIFRLNSPSVKRRRFDPALGHTGGEDDAFFHGIVRDGGTIDFAPAAVVREAVPKERERLSFLLRRSFRAGQTYALLNPSSGRGARAVKFTKAVTKVGVLMGLAGLVCFRPARRTKALMRASLHAGVCSHLLGGTTLELYRP